MPSTNVSAIFIENASIQSVFLQREVKVDFYLPMNIPDPSQMSLLLINDGQDMEKAGLQKTLEQLYTDGNLKPLLCVGIHAGEERRMEYAVASKTDYKGRGAKAGLYTSFVIEELIPYIKETYRVSSFKEKAFAGFSLGGLSALDIVWNYADEFSKVGVFSGSFWWRSVDQSDKDYDDDKHRIMQQQIRNGEYRPGLKFFFQCGNMDETKDRNQNGIIDSIDDTLDVIKELEAKGYENARLNDSFGQGKDIYYLELKDGRHDIETWGRALPVFLKWGWSKG